MGTIINMLKTIGDFFAMLFDVVGMVIKGLVDFCMALMDAPFVVAKAFSMLPLPPVVLTGVASIIAVVIVVRVIGRD